MGRRSNRTPFFYPEYRLLFQRHFHYVVTPEEADVLVFALAVEIRDEIDDVQQVLSRNPDVRLVVISEEPLWDTLWGGNFTSKQVTIQIGEYDYRLTVLNHFTTKIYNFEKIPYFPTTNGDFFARYSTLFNRNRQYTVAELLALWEKAPIRAAFYAERREEPIHDFQFPEFDVMGLSRYRTVVAKGVQGDGVVRVGHGWGSTIHRHKMPGWHLDKLAALDRQAFMISGIENTHQWNYVTEKIFDAFAVLGVPLYFAGPTHSVMRLVPPGSFINLYGLSANEAIEKICTFEPDRVFAECYLETQARLAELFSNPMHLVQERKRVVAEVVSDIETM